MIDTDGYDCYSTLQVEVKLNEEPGGLYGVLSPSFLVP